MIDFCGRNGCRMYSVSRSIDSRPLQKPWYCSATCRDIATRPMHWLDPLAPVAACGGASVQVSPHLITPDLGDVTCRNCKRTGAWKKALVA